MTNYNPLAPAPTDMPEGKTDPFLLAVFASLGRELLRSCVVANMPADQKPFAVEDRNLLELLDISKYKLKVPAYQRSYEWTEKDVTTLLKNVLETFRATAADKYLLLGSVLLRSEARNVTPALCDIVDGQQRLSTIMLLYSALYKRGQELLATEHQGSTKLTDALASLAKRFITDDDKRVLTLEFALGGSDDEDTNNVVQTWKSLTYFGNAALDATELLRQKDRYLIRWANVYEWVKQHCKHETRLVEIVQHVNERVYVSVTLVYDLRLAMRCFHDCNTTGSPSSAKDMVLNIHAICGMIDTL